MGTSGAYTGAGGKAGKDVAAGIGEWLDDLPGGTGVGEGGANDSDDEQKVGDKDPVELPPRLIAGTLGLLGPRSPSGSGADGSGIGGASGPVGGGTGGGGGARRSTSRVSRSTGRAAAAAYAYATADRAGLSELGLDYDDLRALGDPIEVTRRIVEAACGPRSNSTLEEHEERYVAAGVAEWVLEQSEDNDPPTPEETARHAIATIISEVISSEMGEALRRRPEEVSEIAESELRDAAEVLASKAELSVGGTSEAELSRAIEDGVETLRQIYGVVS